MRQQQMMAAQMATPQSSSENKPDEQTLSESRPEDDESAIETPDASSSPGSLPSLESRPQPTVKTNASVLEDPSLKDKSDDTAAGDLSLKDQLKDTTVPAAPYRKEDLTVRPNQVSAENRPPSHHADIRTFRDTAVPCPDKDVGMQRIGKATASARLPDVRLQIESDDTHEAYTSESFQRMTQATEMAGREPHQTPQLPQSMSGFQHMPPNRPSKQVYNSHQQRPLEQTARAPSGHQRRWQGGPNRPRHFSPQMYPQQPVAYCDSGAVYQYSQQRKAQQQGVDEDATYYMPGTGVVRHQDGQVTFMNSGQPGQDLYYVPNTGVQFAMDSQHQWMHDRN